MENVCYCLQFIVIYHKAIVAIYSGQLDRAAKIIQTELLKYISFFLIYLFIYFKN
jgi:hypothetical protein